MHLLHLSLYRIPKSFTKFFQNTKVDLVYEEIELYITAEIVLRKQNVLIS